MRVNGRVNRAGRALIAFGLILGGVVFAEGPGVVSAASLVAPPERLYMFPVNPVSVIPQMIVNALIPVTEMEFDGGTDVISGDTRSIVLDMEDSQAPNDCDLTYHPGVEADFPVTYCNSISLTVAHGKLSVGPLTEEFEDDVNGDPSNDPALAVYLTSEGARVGISDDADYNADDGVSVLFLNGTTQQLNDSLENLVYTPDPDEDDDSNTADDFYRYEGSNPESIVVLGTQHVPSETVNFNVDIRVLDVNDWPDLRGPGREFGDTSGDGPADQTADPAVEKVIPGNYNFIDEDNDEEIDGDEPDDDPDWADGAETEFLLFGYLDCGVALEPNTGFHFASSTWNTVNDLANEKIPELLEDYFGIDATPDNPEEVQENAWKQLAIAAFLEGLDLADGDANLADQELAINDDEYAEAFAAIGSIQDVRDALTSVSFLHNAEGDTCEMLVVASDLGNNGMPFQYWSPDDPDDRQYGVEVPAIGFDWDLFTIETGELQEVDISFDPTILYVNEGDTAVAPIYVTPPPPGPPAPERPDFSFRWAAVDGTAIAGTDYQGTSNNNPVVSHSTSQVNAETGVFNDIDGNKSFTFELQTPSQLPPGDDTTPPGYEIVSAIPTRTVVIIDDDDPDAAVTGVTGATITEGDVGTTNLSFTINLDKPADGTETVEVDTSSAAPSDPVVDYVPLVDQLVVFAPGSMTATVNVVVNGDYTIESDDQVTLTLSTPNNLSLPVDPSGLGTIENDDTAPTVTITPAATQETPTNDDPVVFTATFDRAVTGFNAAGDVALAWTGTDGETLVPTITPVSSSVYTIAVTGMTSNGTITASVPAGVAADTPGARPNVASPVDAVVEWDITGPTVTINQATTQVDPTSLSPIAFTIEFSEPVTGFAPTEVLLSGSALADTVQLSGAGSSYTAQVSGMDNDGTVVANVAAGVVVDVLGNGNEAATFTDNQVYFDLDEGDQTPPSVTIDQAASQSDPTATSPVLFTAVFSEPVTGFDAADLDLAASTLNGVLTPTITNSGDSMTYTVAVAVSGATMDGVIEVEVPAGAAQDSATNLSLASTSTDNQVTFDVDTVPPTVTINQAASQVDPTTASPVMFTAVFSEPVTGFTDADVVLANGTGGTLTPTVSATADPLVYAVSVAVTSPIMSGTITATVPAGAAQDAASNNSTAATSIDNVVTFQLDTTLPTVTIDQAATQVDPTSNSPVRFTATFSEPVTGFAGTDVTLTNATGGTLTPTVAATADPLVYDVSVAVAGATTTGAITAAISAATVTDLAGNPNQASTSTDNSVTFEVPVPQPLSLAIQVPGNIVRDADPNQNGAIVTYPAPTTTGGTPPVAISCSHQSGDFYPVGVTTVTCTATDSAPDRPPLLDSLMDDPITVVAALTASGTFTITVNQTQPTTTVPGETPPSTTIPGSITPGATLPPQLFPPSGGPGPVPAGGPVGGLPETGSNIADVVAVATTALLMGALLMIIRRRRPAPG